MIAIISPAKNMRQASLQGLRLSTPSYIEKTKQLVEILREYNPWELESLLKVNPDLALQAFQNYHDWDENLKGVAALLAYHGLQYKNIGAEDFTLEDFSFANKKVRMMTGLYGLLKPQDEILPYRLELQTKVRGQGEDLYQFWGDQLYRDLFQDNSPVINLASKEYSKAIEPYLTPKDRLIGIEFKTNRNGKLRTIATLAKMARGQMIRFIVKNRVKKPEQLQDFTWNGYEFMPGLSYEDRYVFVQR